MMTLKLLVLPATILALAACSATGTQFSGFQSPAEGNARIYVYRPSMMVGRGVHYDVHANEQLIGHIRNGGYIEAELTPGEYEIWGKTEVKRGTSVQLSPNTIQCIRTKVGIGIMVGRPQFTSVDLSQCQKEITGTQLSTRK